jgi:cytoskeletal protein CcmA (bactofilin family)
MFGSKKTTEDKTSSLSSGSLNSLVKGTVVTGNVTCEDDIRVDGTIDGNLFCSGKLIVGATGRIIGEIRCTNAVIEGHIEGILKVAELLHLKETAHVVAEVQTQSLSIQSGAYFNATCKMSKQIAAKETANA